MVEPNCCYFKECFEPKWKNTPICFACLKELFVSFRGDKEHFAEEEEEKESKYLGCLLKKTDKVLSLIHGFKYKGFKRNGRFLASFLKFSPEQIAELKIFDYLVPVPLHSLKKRGRGYNQSQVLAEEWSGLLEVPVNNELLKKVKHTGTQTQLGRSARLKNMESSICLKSNKRFDGKRALIIDDVYTTGATTEACAKALKKIGFTEIGVFSLVYSEKKTGEDDFLSELRMAGGFVF